MEAFCARAPLAVPFWGPATALACLSALRGWAHNQGGGAAAKDSTSSEQTVQQPLLDALAAQVLHIAWWAASYGMSMPAALPLPLEELMQWPAAHVHRVQRIPKP